MLSRDVEKRAELTAKYGENFVLGEKEVGRLSWVRVQGMMQKMLDPVVLIWFCSPRVGAFSIASEDDNP